MRVILLLFLVTIAYCQTDFKVWTATTIVTSPQMGSGYFEATVKYDWPAGMMEVSFDSLGYKEFYKFNTDKGYNAKVSTGQFTYQYLYKSSPKCPCEIVGLQKGMPAWFPLAIPPNNEPNYNIPYYSTVTPNNNELVTLSGTPKIATKYSANVNFKATLPTGEKSFVLSPGFWYDPAAAGNLKLAGFQLTDPNDQQRTFTVTGLTQAATGTLGLAAPTSACPCRKLVDIALSLDRSGSISYNQWGLEFDFVKGLANSFEYGPTAANMGISNWNSKQWPTIALSEGTSLGSVMGAVNQMKCCQAGSGDQSCCCCGTPIGGGIALGGNMLLAGRPQATKILIVLTDGCQNHLWVESPAPAHAVQCECATEKICAGNKTCTGDITKWFDIVTQQYVPGTKVLAIGVGAADTICRDQLVMAAGGDETNVYNPQGWAELATIVQTISATSCSITATPCVGCCGICTCGVCIPANKCFNLNKCSIGVIDNTTQCCRSDTIVCPEKACNIPTCDNAAGCGLVPLTCNQNSSCAYWQCTAATKVCQQFKKPDNELPPECIDKVIDECEVAGDCGVTTDPCKNVTCIKPDPKTPAYCKVTQVTCPPSDNCTSRICRPGVGCVSTTKPCNDLNNCTLDTCLPNVLGGCVYTSIGECPAPKDPCKKSLCHREKGCIEVAVNCSERGYFVNVENCTVPACNKTCYNLYVCFVPPPSGSEAFPTSVVLISSLTTAAIVGIVVAAAVLVVGLGGAAGVAIAGAAGAGGVALVAQNPIYAPSGASGTNALFKDQS